VLGVKESQPPGRGKYFTKFHMGMLRKRKIEHIRNIKVFKSGSNVASHAWLEGHTIDFENARFINRGNSRVRKTLESWHTAITSQADNNSK